MACFKFADNTKMGRMAHSLKGSTAVKQIWPGCGGRLAGIRSSTKADGKGEKSLMPHYGFGMTA